MADQGPITRQLVDSYSQTVACLGEGPIVVKAECSKVVPASLPLHPREGRCNSRNRQCLKKYLATLAMSSSVERGMQAVETMVAT